MTILSSKTFNELINEINEHLTNDRDRGTAFEKMVVAYLKNEPIYKKKYSDVWMLSDVPTNLGISRIDTGVDIVAKDFNGQLTAVQAKFYKGKVGKDAINSFVAETGKDCYSAGIIVSTTDEWNKNAESTLKNTSKPFSIIGLTQLKNSSVDWSKFSFSEDNDLSIKKSKKLRGYQEEAIKNAVEYFKSNEEYHDRGKLIMAPGTGKTFTSLKITEALMKDQVKSKFNVLYLVPSIQLLSQTLFNWNDDVSEDIHMTSFSVVSDRKATKKGKESEDDLSSKDIGFPATTDVNELIKNYEYVKELDTGREMTVVFSTYQSIDVIKQAQEMGYPEFDLIIADEAHRTTGANKLNEDSMFTEVHSNSNVKGKIRLYQTATPKIYDQNAKKKAEENSIVVSSMDDPAKYGHEIFRLGFGDAVAQGYLTDYKVSVLAVSESYINKDMQQIMAADNQLKVDDIGKIIGVWNAMVKRNGITGEVTGAPMKRAIAFSDTIKHSKAISKEFSSVVNEYLDTQSSESFMVDVHHVDGGLNALQKTEQIDWLGDEHIEENRARILSNVRFLTEGIDVPNLDAIIFFSPKKSQVDIVQAVGRIMRKAQNKEYGYIILPIVVSEGVDPSSALDNDSKYKEVWQVLNALRSTDDRFDAEVNKIDLNKKKPDNLELIGVNSSPDSNVTEEDGLKAEQENATEQLELPLDWQEMRNAFYGKVVQKVGDRRYLEDWSKDVADIAKRHITRISDIIDSNDGAKMAFDNFLNSLHYNINNSIGKEQAIEMLAQHLITEPIFEALFGEYSFVRNNAVSKSMNDVVGAFSLFGFDKEQAELKPFYDSIKLRATGIDNASGKQKLILTLYDKFFRTGFKKTTEQLGIVFTPVEVVDFIVNSVDDSLRKYFDKSLIDKNVHILDPFTGTGTFMTRLLYHFKEQLDKGEITFDDILSKYTHDMHANEIVLLSYYIAAINIESTFEEINNEYGNEKDDYKQFEGIVLTDTFASTENKDTLDDKIFGENDERLKKEQETPITVIIGNPPYSVGQRYANDENQNTDYPNLNLKIENTYSKNSKAILKRSLYDSYIKAFRWASDRLERNGIVSFVSNGSFIDSQSTDGLRKSLYEEFNHLYVYNLRGDQRTQGEISRKEGGKIFGSGSRTPIAISILVKDGTDNHELHYYDIGDYLTREDKLKKLQDNNSVKSINWKEIFPDKNNDWINQRDENYEQYTSMYNKNDLNNSVYQDQLTGVNTGRDAWVSGFSKEKTINISKKLVSNYESEMRRLSNVTNASERIKQVNMESDFISWTRGLKKDFSKGKHLSLEIKNVIPFMYRPFTKKWIINEKKLMEMPSRYFDINDETGMNIYIQGQGMSRPFSAIITELLPSFHFNGTGKGFPMYKGSDAFGMIDNVSDSFKKKINLNSKEIVFYVYAVLNSKTYLDKYASDLNKEFPRIPILKHKEKYVEIGEKLSNLHLNYENQDKIDYINVEYTSRNPSYGVKKMKHPKRGVLDTIVYNNDIKITNIPERAYDYVVNGRPAIEWIIDQYQVKTDKKSGITDDPNEFSDDPKYILNLLLSVITVSMNTLDLIDKLPPFEIDE
ncbi:helicase [Apilactobacillus kunkeei]|uniref:type ISP restriction/modification enzyme n=1 Tax=Apilactobacillus kunkeei TaxID=148814 RepID=UPI00059AF5BC|nr:type ISP restriction/modification enzyme [Apilactobacillus kunkeei]KIM18358.1 helicase [Apilactobacillus kunkeei]